MQQLIHVKIGLTDGVYPVRKFYTEGVFKDIYEYQENANTIAWVHKRWCTPVSAPQAASDSVSCHGLQAVDSVPATTDWRSFLRTHWDATHNHCQVEHLDEFYAIFRRAAAAYINKQNHEQDKVKSHHQSGTHESRRTDALLHPSGRHGSAAAVSQGNTGEVRATADAVTSKGSVSRKTVAATVRKKPVELSLFPDL